MSDFSNSSYLSQVRKLRRLADQVLRLYSVKLKELRFIHHGENCTFRVITHQKSFLLRIHRNNNHSIDAIKEELRWLSYLAEETDIKVQRPVKSKNNNFIENVVTKEIPEGRYCVLLSWNSGAIRSRGINEKHFKSIGTLTGKLHLSSQGMSFKHRNYWSIKGLLGPNAHFGPLADLENEIGRDFKDLEKCRALIENKLNEYAKKGRSKKGMIHADLHFGNLVWNGEEVSPIDFDDCGQGFFLYDLAVTLYSSSRHLQHEKKKFTDACRNSYLESYQEIVSLNDYDLSIIPYFIVARRLTMLGWIFARRDNPRLYQYFKKSFSKTMKEFRKVLKEGP